jgi:hypothetical protein
MGRTYGTITGLWTTVCVIDNPVVKLQWESGHAASVGNPRFTKVISLRCRSSTATGKDGLLGIEGLHFLHRVYDTN